MLTWLTPVFAVTALIYASVGFAGGSTYTALLVLAGVSYAAIPVISLLCNIIVASGGVARFGHAGAIPWRRVAPLLLLSVPAAWLGGSLPIDEGLFAVLLATSLLTAGLLLLWPVREKRETEFSYRRSVPWVAIVTAAPLGLLAGIVGIGGGIFLAPVLHLIRWDQSRKIAGAAALFILVNSLAGLAGQATKFTDAAMLSQLIDWWPLALAVLVGGQLGSWAGVKALPARMIRIVTGAVVIIAAIRLLTVG